MIYYYYVVIDKVNKTSSRYDTCYKVEGDEDYYNKLDIPIVISLREETIDIVIFTISSNDLKILQTFDYACSFITQCKEGVKEELKDQMIQYGGVTIPNDWFQNIEVPSTTISDKI